MNASLLKARFYSFFNMVKRGVPLILAGIMIFNLSGEAVAQIRATGGQNNFFNGNGGAAGSQSFSFQPGYPFPGLDSLNNIDKEQLQINITFASLTDKLSYEQFKTAVQKELGPVTSGLLEEESYKAGFDFYKAGLVGHELQIREAAAFIKKLWPYNVDKAYSHMPRAKGGQICQEGKCFDEVIYNHALLRTLLNEAVGTSETNKAWKWNDEIMMVYVKPVYYISADFGADGNDAALLRKYFTSIISKTGDYCDNDIYKAEIVPGLANADDRQKARDGKEKRAKYCEGAGFAMSGLAVMESTAAQKEASAALIYKMLKKSYRDDYGAIVLSSAIPSLMALGTNSAYANIEKFLLVESLNDGLSLGSGWQVLGKALDIISIKAWVDKFTDINNRIRGRGGRFLNKVGIKMQYIDSDAATELGYSNFSIALAKDGHSGYNMPYGNILEDIGYMLSSSRDSRAKKIAQKAVNLYADAFKNPGGEFIGVAHDMAVTTPVRKAYDLVHIPLVVGAIKGGGVTGGNANIAVDKLYNLDWWDLNEGTQRRINNLMAKTGTKYTSNKMPLKAADEIKKIRASRNSTIGDMAVWADMAVAAVMIAGLIVSIPSMVKGASGLINTASRIRAIKAAGKTNLLKSVSANIKASGVKPSVVKAGLQAKYQENAVLARSEVLRAKRGIKAGPDGAAIKTPAQSATQTSAKAVQNTAADGASRASMAEKVRAANAAKKPSTVQYTLVENDVKTADVLGKNKTLTATVGEGGGGAAAAADATPLTKAQRAFRAQQEAEREIALYNEAIELLTPVTPKAFKGGRFFNKPYSELPKWKQFAFDNWYFHAEPALARAGELLSIPFKSPKTALMGGIMPIGTTAQIANPIAIYSSIGSGARTSASVSTVFDAANTVKSMAGASYGVSNTLRPVTLVKGLNTANPWAVKAFMPQIVGVLNEFHGGPSASFRNTYNQGALAIRAIKDIGFMPAVTSLEFDERAPKANADIEAKTGAAAADINAEEADYNGHKIFEQALRYQMTKRSLTKSNKARHEILLTIAPYISPKLATELLDIIDVNPNGYAAFDAFADRIIYMTDKLKDGHVITLNLDRLPNLNKGAIDTDIAGAMLVIADDPFIDLLSYVSQSANKMVVNIAKKYETLTPAGKEKALRMLVGIHLESMAAGAPTRPYLSAQSGERYEWENVAASDDLRFALGKEVKGEFFKGNDFPIFKRSKNYKEFLAEYRTWLIKKLNARQESPAVLFENKEGTLFIYSNDGQTRFRAGGHETILSRKTAFHFHIEYLDATDGTWKGPMNYNYRWPNQDMLPSDLVKDMIYVPVEQMKKANVLVDKEGYVPSDGFFKNEIPGTNTIDYTFDGIAVQLLRDNHAAANTNNAAEAAAQAPKAVKYEGFKVFEQTLRKQMEERSLTPSNKKRHNALLKMAPFISPKLATQLLGIVDASPKSYESFDALSSRIFFMKKDLKDGQVITLNRNSLPELGVINYTVAKKLLSVEDNVFKGILSAISEKPGEMVANMADKYEVLSPDAKEKALKKLLNMYLQSMYTSAPFILSQNGANYGWEDVASSDGLKFALGKEETGYYDDNVFASFWRSHEYKDFLDGYEGWLIKKLEATPDKPAVLVENKDGTVFIYSNDGQTRLRAVTNENQLSEERVYFLDRLFFHIEYFNTIEKRWGKAAGPRRFNYRWPNQIMPFADFLKDMLYTPIEQMKKANLLVDRKGYIPPSAKPMPSSIVSYPFDGIAVQLIKDGQAVGLIRDAQQLVTEVRSPEIPQWLGAPYQAMPDFADPIALAGFLFLPWLSKKKLTATRRQVAKNQSFNSVIPNDDAEEFVTVEGEDGYGLSYEDPATGKEILLPVNVKLDRRLAVQGYNRVTFNKNDIAELRDGAAKPEELSHFFMALDNANGELKSFVASIIKAKLAKNFKIKIEDKHSGARKTVITNLYSASGKKALPVDIEIDAKFLPTENSRVVLMPSGRLGILDPWKRQPVELDATIRLPKNQIANMVAVLRESPISYNITLAPTEHKANVVIRDVSITNVSLGKTFAPVVKHSLGMSEADATSLMFVLNYLLPGLSSFLNPILRKYGEKKILLTALALSAAAGYIAWASGFWGFVETLPPATYRTVAFSTAITLMAVAGILKQLVSNMLIKANRGDTSDKKVKKDAAAQAAAQKAAEEEKVTFKDITNRMKEVMFKKSTLSLQDAFYYNLSFIWKNAGTLKFLALPYAINETIRFFSGIDMGFDYSLSFPIYALYSTYAFFKVYNTNLRDAYSTKDKAADKKARAEAKAARDAMHQDLTAAGKMLEKAKAFGKGFAKEFMILWDVLANKKHVWQVSAAMTFATVHEFVMSSTFASQLNASFEDGAAANFFVALCLYIPLVFGRILGNTVGKKISPASLYLICSALSAIGTSIMMGGAVAPAVTMAGAALASLGVGNFFTQMYDYITSMHREHNREISVILALTMTVAAIMSLPVRYIAEDSDVANIDLMIAMGALVFSLALTVPMMRGSTIYKYIQGKFKKKDASKGSVNDDDAAGMGDPLEN